MSTFFLPKPCTCCGTMFQPTGGNARFCPQCRSPEAVRERNRRHVRAWHKADPERSREARRRWRENRKLKAATA